MTAPKVKVKYEKKISRPERIEVEKIWAQTFPCLVSSSSGRETFIKVYEKCLQHIHQDYIGEQVFSFPSLTSTPDMEHEKAFGNDTRVGTGGKSRRIERRKLIIGRSIEY